ncbi:MAG: PDDEXK nuclease domain-containing protein, partial [bacterium]|nr:PDDEXK nuclease domain-containing protein [bacterium]
KRNYYINICIKKNLSSRALEKMIKSNAYERLSIKDKENINIITKEEDLTISDMLKNPIYIEVERNIDKISEKLLQELIIEKLEKILLELGHGFTYAGKEVKLGESYCDMLFFNTELNSYVVIELKIRKLQKQDIGQIEYYMNYIDRNIKKSYHNKTIGVILCKYDNYLVMEYCSNSNIYETTYQLINKDIIEI